MVDSKLRAIGSLNPVRLFEYDRAPASHHRRDGRRASRRNLVTDQVADLSKAIGVHAHRLWIAVNEGSCAIHQSITADVMTS